MRKTMFKWAINLWEGGHTPQGFAQSSPSMFGRGILQRYVNRRFAEDVPAKPEFAEYMYQHWQGDGNRSGERIMNALLHPGAFAKRPLCTRIPSLEPGLPISFCYGSDDWMDIDSGHGVADIMNNEGACTRPDVLVHEVANSGHQLYIDQPVEFNQVILTGCRSRAPLEPLTTTS